MENNKNKKSVKFQGDMLNFCDFIQVFVFTRNHHLNESSTNDFVKDDDTVDSRYLNFSYLEQPLISKRKSGPCLNLRSGNKILSIRGEMALREQFHLFSTIFSIYISK